ncbi:hypothetical protein [Variovorax sp. OV329]|uniref:hypothetical protein n=1 Tax=Variovorax sp. OV329 TaxID=1882825 RepID=UPI0008EA0730|nr:hypothetical protein [Variovorax sp. OV329]SFN03651.1 hypothetical protein SAMN05444747_113129 [Variovorax sp. OV329]
MDFHHPLFQSLALPLVLAFVVTGALRALLGPGTGARWAALGVPVAVLVTVSWVLGWRMPPNGFGEKLPWALLAAVILGIVLEAVRADRRATWLAAGLLWAVLLVALGQQPWMARVGSWLVGMAVIGAVVHEVHTRADAAAMLVVASLGLAVTAMMSGSALLFELCLGLAAAVGGAALWVWPVPRISLGTSGLLVAVLGWLSLAQGTALLTHVRPGAVLLLAAAFSACTLLRIWRHRLHRGERSAWAEALAVAAVAALWVVAALAIAHWAPLRTNGGAAKPADDAYYAPKW